MADRWVKGVVLFYPLPHEVPIRWLARKVIDDQQEGVA
jgi:hypothetical protein